MKKKILAALIIFACLLLAIGGTISYFTATEKAHNVITTGSVEIKLIEKTDTGEDFKSPVINALPGAAVSKIVTIENTGKNSCWVRIAVDRFIEADGRKTDASELLLIDFNTADWTINGEYYYYNKELLPGETAKPLFEKVTLSKNIDSSFADSEANVDVTCYAVQAANNGKSVFEATGWPDTDNK